MHDRQAIAQLGTAKVLVYFVLGLELNVARCHAVHLRRLHNDANTGRRSGLGGFLHEGQKAHDESMVAEAVDLNYISLL